jgi:hypothetical protein
MSAKTVPVVNRLTGSSSSLTYFEDSAIDTVQLQIGAAVGVHPDRLRIYVQGQFDGDYYAKDARKWENLFLRMSPEGKVITGKSVESYGQSRDSGTPPTATYDKSAWMSMNPAVDAPFRELRIMGVPEQQSWVYPLSSEAPEHLPPASQVNIDSKSMFKTHHPYKVVQFQVIPYEGELAPQVELRYYPRLRSGSPAVVPADLVRTLARQAELVGALNELSVPKPENASIVQARWKLPLVDTDFGNSVRNRFEQIFYGTTVSKENPVVSFFSSRQEQSRHKFFTDSPAKTPYMDVRMWSYWWTATKPVKNRPALLFYRGTGRHAYDRITVNAVEITLSCSRPDDGGSKLEDLRNQLREFLLSIDGLSQFLLASDYEDDRWDLQDVSAVLHYGKELKEADFRRFDCLRSVYEVVDHDRLVFRLLRADQSDTGLSDHETQVLQLLQDNEYTSVDDIREQITELSGSEAAALLASVRSKIEENPDIADRSAGLYMPTFKVSARNVLVTHSPDIQRVSRYIDVLRDILLHPDNPDLDGVCPKRAEIVAAETAVVRVIEPAAAAEAAPLDDDEFDILGMIADEAPKIAAAAAAPSAAEAAAKPAEKKTARKVAARNTKTSLAGYFMTQLREFDSDTFDPTDPTIFHKCDKPRQPIIMAEEELAKFTDALAPYDPRSEGYSKVMDVKDPNGSVICPELWCTVDRIPLKPDQLVDGACPVCKGKIRSTDKAVEKTQDIIEFPIIRRESRIVFPGYVSYKSKKNEKQIPCCFTTAQTTKITHAKPPSETPTTAEAFYVLGETKTRLGELRIGYIPAILSRLLGLKPDYSEIMESMNRVQSGGANFFRVGVGHAKTTLPKILNYAARVKSPAENPKVTVQCSFFRSWKQGGDAGDEGDPIAARVRSIDKAFTENMLSPLEELEYVAASLSCMAYVLFVSPDSIQSSCFMPLRNDGRIERAVVVAIDAADPASIDFISHVSRTAATPVYNGNLFNPLFPDSTRKTMEELRRKACVSDIPTIENASAFLEMTPALKVQKANVKIILDPYLRAQALLIPKVILLPFRPTPKVPSEFLAATRVYYSDVPQDDYPQKLDTVNYLGNASKDVHPGFAYAHDMTDASQNVVEVITKSGLRVPVVSSPSTVEEMPGEIVPTVAAADERALAFAQPDPEAVRQAQATTYEAEIFDFLIFQLTKDVNGRDEDYADLRRALSASKISAEELRPLLFAWIDDTLTFHEAAEPPAFYSKVRRPCSGQAQSKCTGLCVWDGASCKVEVKTVSEGLKKDAVSRRLLSTLASNDKIRNAVFENRISPFFSSILYLVYPHEVILSDQDIKK